MNINLTLGLDVRNFVVGSKASEAQPDRLKELGECPSEMCHLADAAVNTVPLSYLCSVRLFEACKEST